VRICKRCKQVFTPIQPYHQLCWPCWHVEHADDEPDASADEAAWHAGYQAGYQAGRREGEMPPAIFKGLLRLCHPDGYSGSTLEPLAHELTVWLLSHRPDSATVERN
jgi:hypothetical protein